VSSGALSSGLDRFVAALDRARSLVLGAALRVPGIRGVLHQRSRRIEARAAATIVIALGLSIVAPAFMLALGPILFGVPHVASEIRYLVVRRGLARRWLTGLALACLTLSSLRLVEQLAHAPGTCAPIEVGLALVGTLAAGALATNGRAGLRRFALAAAVLIGVGLVGIRYALWTRLVFIHLHNFGALLLWVLVFRKRGPFPRTAVVLLGGAVLLILSGATAAWSARIGSLAALGVSIPVVAQWLSPGVALEIAIPLALLHAFSDSVHYGAWLGLIPEEEARAEGSLTFRMTARSLLRDFGVGGVAVCVAAMAVVLGGSLLNLAETRRFYFSAAGFHGYLEVAVLMILFVRGERSLVRSAVEPARG
jgi:hypothetical protein